MSLKPTTKAMIGVAKQTRAKHPKKFALHNEFIDKKSKAGKAQASFNRKLKKTRKGMADRYRSIRNNPSEGPHIARVFMRAGGPAI